MIEDNPYITSSSQAIEHATVNSLLCMDKKNGTWRSSMISLIYRTRNALLEHHYKDQMRKTLFSGGWKIQVNIQSRLLTNCCNLIRESGIQMMQMVFGMIFGV